ncbi:MAG: hypothetical protein RLZZ515_2055 [Cyanobacteriota bacterium]
MINPSRIRILAVGKVRKGWVLEGIATYLKRLPGLQVLELRDAGKEREAAAILEALRPDEQLVVLAEEGQTFDSPAFAQRLEGSGSERLALVIGGAEGIDPALKAKARWKLSLSPMTFPHELARRAGHITSEPLPGFVRNVRSWKRACWCSAGSSTPQMLRRSQITPRLAWCRSVEKQSASCSALRRVVTSASASRLARKSPPAVFQAVWALRCTIR